MNNTDKKKELLEEQILKLTGLEQGRSEALASINALKTELLNEQIADLSCEDILKRPQELFSTQQNKIKLRNFLKSYPTVKIDISYLATGTYCLQVAFDQRKPFVDQLNEIKPFLPHLMLIPEIITLPLKITGQHIKIREYHLGDEGIYELIKPDYKNEIWLCRTKSYLTSIIKKFSTWEESLEHVYNKHPYFK